MNLSYLIVKDHHFPDINLRAHDHKDFWRHLKKRKIFFEEKVLPVDGCYRVDERGREFITINKNLTGMEWLRTAFHEALHSCLDYPIDDELVELFRSLKTLQTRKDMTAEALSLVLLFPFTELERYIIVGEIRPELLPYVTERLQILDYYDM